MNLWVRSQNGGTLMQVKILGKTDTTINAYYETGCVKLGIYETEDRALEVLDEIQDLLQNAYVGNSNRIIYQMPEK